MSSEQRSNSAVRNLRSIFENKTNESPDPRGRSPGSFGDIDNQRPRSKIRASFIPVEPTMAALAAEQNAADSDPKQESSIDLRRPSFREGKSGDAVDAVRETVNTEQERREKESSIEETIPETAVETPAAESTKILDGSTSQKTDKQAENPDKHLTGAEEEPAVMTAANPADEAAVSGGQALPPVAEDLRKSTKETASKLKPVSIATKGSSKPPSSIKSPVSQSSSSSQRAPVKKASRSSLTAPTAASVARAAAADKATATKQSSPKPKPREVPKAAEVSSRLTAPTAATRARQESSSAVPIIPKPAASTSRIRPTASARPTPRSSLARPESRSSQTASKKPAAPVDGSFLERMTRPTAASANRAQEKADAQTTPKKQVSLRPKTNGQPKASAAAEPAVVTEHTSAPEADLHEEGESQPENIDQASAHKVEEVVTAHESKGTERESTLQANGHEEEAPALESTPSAVREEEVIR